MFNNNMNPNNNINPYEILGVSNNINNEQLKNAYRKLALKYHPDVNNDPEANKYFKEINSAYDLLKTPNKRTEYDKNYSNDESDNKSNDKSEKPFDIIFKNITKIKINKNKILIYTANFYQFNGKIEFSILKGKIKLNDKKSCNPYKKSEPEHYPLKIDDESGTKLAPLYIDLFNVITDNHNFYSGINPKLKIKSSKTYYNNKNIINNYSWKKIPLSSKELINEIWNIY